MPVLSRSQVTPGVVNVRIRPIRAYIHTYRYSGLPQEAYSASPRVPWQLATAPICGPVPRVRGATGQCVPNQALDDDVYAVTDRRDKDVTNRAWQDAANEDPAIFRFHQAPNTIPPKPS
jgi:hypothetical protein